MVLNYKGFNNNWVLEEADTIAHAPINTGLTAIETLKEVRKEIDEENPEYPLILSQRLREAIEDLIRQETAAVGEISFRNVDLKSDFNLVAVLMDDRYVRVFPAGHGVYILNNSGKTIHRL